MMTYVLVGAGCFVLGVVLAIALYNHFGHKRELALKRELKQREGLADRLFVERDKAVERAGAAGVAEYEAESRLREVRDGLARQTSRANHYRDQRDAAQALAREKGEALRVARSALEELRVGIRHVEAG
jgi:hypothetical protein